MKCGIICPPGPWSGVPIPDEWGTLGSPVPLQIGKIENLESLQTPVLKMILRPSRADSFVFYFRAFREVTGGPGGPCGCDPRYPFGIGSSPQVLTGYGGSSEVRKALDYPGIFNLSVGVDQTGAGSPARGLIKLSATPEQTRMLPQGGVWDLSLNDGTPDFRKTLVVGNFKLILDVSL